MAGEHFRDVPNADAWLERDFAAKVQLYRYVWQAPNFHSYDKRIDEPPRYIRRFDNETEWAENEIGPQIWMRERTLPFEQWKELVGELENADGPTLPDCSDSHVVCDDERSKEYQCRAGVILGHYSMDLGHDRGSGVIVEYRWKAGLSSDRVAENHPISHHWVHAE